MKLRAMLLVAIVCAAVLGVAQDKESTKPAPPSANAASALPQGLPEEYGFYHKTDQGWERMHQNRAGKSEMKVGFATRVTGIGGIHQKLDYGGPHAQCQIAQARPTFYVRTVDPSHIQDLVIVRFLERKDKRQVETSEMTREESRSKATAYSVTVKRLSPEVFVVTPESDLPAGEYVLSESTYATEGYDFGIRGASIPN